MTAEGIVVPETARPVPALLTDPAWHTALAVVREQALIDTHEPAAIIELLTRAVDCAEHDGDRALAESGWARILNLALTRDDHAGLRSGVTDLSHLYRRWDHRQYPTKVASDLIDTGDPAAILELGRNRNALCCGAMAPSETNR
ncbi:hypothetical protein [Amycolatopsis sp. DG1A-15b]|uniref:hypothetical protein n=1 Tax=Amycolatopsis sp. DG1A-15b TaxID=3052846 RepID=UPI00255BA3FD|nr:hypothetical protein [Amycolatopsis sp. DG1A-15b]WIX85753.1 hypothetical protein QRY02_31685 [Amycolatopsis sp. DG1A-15b]